MNWWQRNECRVFVAVLVILWAWAMTIPEQSTGAAQDNQAPSVQVGRGIGVRSSANVPNTSGPASAPTHTDQLVVLMNEGCIEWDEPISERRLWTCGDTLPAVKVVSWERRFIQ